MYNLNKDAAVKSVKTIVDCNRCTTCDQLSEPCVRYPCGHAICEKCFVKEEYCCICLSQPDHFTHYVDEPYSLREQHASDLVTAFEDAFNLDVNRRSRMSDQMKLEKELFPKCIQAPVKYSNKRKTKNIKKLSSPLSTLPGENTYKSTIKMSKFDYVQQWLNNSEQSCSKLFRKPLSDLNVNRMGSSNKKYHITQNNISPSSGKKRKHIKAFKIEKEKDMLKKRNRKAVLYDNSLCSEFDKDDSGIVLEVTTDKDKLACMAVTEAALNENNLVKVDETNNKLLIDTTDATNTSETKNIYKNNLVYKVPFNKKGVLVETCRLCRDFISHATDKTANIVNITVDSNNFIATIKISNDKQLGTKEHSMKSVPVQTNISCFNKVISNEIVNESKELSRKCMTEGTLYKNVLEKETLKVDCGFETNDETFLPKQQDNNMAINKKLKLDENTATLPKCVIVEDSDSSNLDANSDIFNDTLNVIEVTADVHESCNLEDYILKSLHENEYLNRTRNPARGSTPESTNSSEKENFDPNRIKKTQGSQKKCVKK